MAGLSHDEVRDALVFFAPVPNEDEMIDRLRLLMRALAEGRTDPIVPRDKMSTDSTYNVVIEVSDDRGWEVQYNAHEFSSGYYESGKGTTLIDALRDLQEEGGR